MTGMNKSSMGRQAALAAVERIKRLLELSEHDPQAREVLVATDKGCSQLDRERAAVQQTARHATPHIHYTNVAQGILGPAYFAAKRRHFDQLRAETSRRSRPLWES